MEFTRAANTQSKIFSSEATGKLDKNVIFTEETRQDVLGVVAPVSAAFLQEQESQKVGNKGYHRWKKRYRTTAGRNDKEPPLEETNAPLKPHPATPED